MDASKEQLLTEQECISKLKLLVIREKKTNALLTAEVERLSSAKDAAIHQKALIEEELNRLKEEFASFRVSSFPSTQNGCALANESESSGLKRKPSISSVPTHRCSELSDHDKSFIPELIEQPQQSFQQSSIVKTFSTCELNKENGFVCPVKKDSLTTLYLESQSSTTPMQSRTQLSCPEALFETGWLLHERHMPQNSSICNSSLKVPHSRAASLPSLVDSAHCIDPFHSSAHVYNRWHGILINYLNPVLQNVEYDFGIKVPHSFFLLQCANAFKRASERHLHLATSATVHSDVDLLSFSNDLPLVLQTLSELWYILFPGTQLTAATTNCPATFEAILKKVRELKACNEIISCDHSSSGLYVNDCESAKISRLEKRIHEMELYASEQVDQAKMQIIELTQKIEHQAADYDQLIRDKDSEMSELRELCDRFSEELAIYSNFWYSLMTFYCAVCPTLAPTDNFIDWSSVAAELQSNDFSLDARELTKLLSTFSQELKLFLERSAGAAVRSDVATRSDSPNVTSVDGQTVSHTNERCTQELQLTGLRNELSNAHQAHMKVVASSAETHDKLLKQEVKMQRMKSMLLRLKQEENDRRADLQQARQDIARLQAELVVAVEESKELKSLKEQSEKLVTSNLDEIFKLKSKLLHVKEERDFALDRYRKLQDDFSAYKIKAVSKLRNSSTEHPTITRGVANNGGSCDAVTPVSVQNHSIEPSEVSQLKARLSTVEQYADEAALRASLARAECDSMREELKSLKQKYNTVLIDFQQHQRSWETQLSKLTQERDNLAKTHEQKLANVLEAERIEFERRLQSEIDDRQTLLREERNQWNARLDSINNKNRVLQEQLDALRKEFLVDPDKNTLLLETESVPPPLSPEYRQTRVGGDGADNDSSAHNQLQDHSLCLANTNVASPRYSSKLLFLPLDQLLSNGDQCQYQSIVNQSSTISSPQSDHASVVGLRNALRTQQRRVDNLVELLHESETTVGRLEDQAKVLKDEIRRLERIANVTPKLCDPEELDNAKVNGVSDPHQCSPVDSSVRIEYFKNVILKLITSPKGSSERAQLVTVLSSLLTLTAAESQILQLVTFSESSPGTSSDSNTSWSGYLFGWRN